MKNSEIRALSDEQLITKVKEEETAFVKLKFQHAVSPIENPMRLRQTRRLIARLQTEVRARRK